RGFHVTGVQTYALPISLHWKPAAMMRFAILGAGGHGQVVADALRQARKAGALDQLSEVFFLDEDATLDGSRVLDVRVIAGEAVEIGRASCRDRRGGAEV